MTRQSRPNLNQYRPSDGGALTAVLGPTNTGKTYFAIEGMLSHRSGMIGLPLRLLAREVYDKVRARVGDQAVALVTGEEKIVPSSARYWVSTVEAMPLEREVDFLAIDEVQLAADLERGRIFTSRLMSARGVKETLFLGSETMRPILRRLFPEIEFAARERFSTLSYAGSKKVTRLPRRTAIVGFSSDTVYAVAELIRRQRGGAAVVLGALSPRTRNAQAAMYQSGEVDYLIATDAIGMGLNMDIDHVAFSAKRKFDGRASRDLRPDELAQIAGRAGRHIKNGSFGVTADCRPFDEETVAAIENHQFEPVQGLQWRSEALDFSSLHALRRSLDRPAPREEFFRARPDEDELALAWLSSSEDIRNKAKGVAALSLLWDVCQIPDYRKNAMDEHAKMVREIFDQIIEAGRISEAWLAPKVERLGRTDGDIDAISTRIAYIRTWTYLSHRVAWLENAAYWQEKTRAIEDSLSDALHEKLTQRFVDRRTSILLKKLRDDEPVLAGVNDDGEVIVEGQFVGRLMGFEFIVDPRAKGVDAKRVRTAADKALTPILAARAAALANAAPEELTLREDATIWWKSAPVAHLVKGPAPLRPDLVVRGLDFISPVMRGRIQDRLQNFVASRIEGQLADLIAMKNAADRPAPEAAPAPAPVEKTLAPDAAEKTTNGAQTNDAPADQNAAPQKNGNTDQDKSPKSAKADGPLTSLSRGVAFRLVENFGAMSRSQFGDELKQLGQDERAKLRRLGMRFGEYTIYTPSLLKPAAAQLLTMLWALWTDRQPAEFIPPKAGLVSVVMVEDLPHAYYYASGYRPSGKRAVRIDMLERLAGQIRNDRKNADNRGGFEATSQMMSLVGCSGEEFEEILKSLGYRKHTVKRPAPVEAESAPDTASPDAAKPESPSSEDKPATATPDAAGTGTGPAPADEKAAAEATPAPTEEGAASPPPGEDSETVTAGTAEEAGAPEENAATATAPAAPDDGGAADEAKPKEASAEATRETSGEIEVVLWRHAPRRPPQKRHFRDNKNNAGKGRQARGDKPHRGKKGRGPQRAGSRTDGPRNDGPGQHRRPPRREKKADPNSPFAVLAALKDNLSKDDSGVKKPGSDKS